MKTRLCHRLQGSFLAAGLVIAGPAWFSATTPANAQTSKTGAAPRAYQKLLTVADLESVIGIKGLKLVPRDSSKGAGGDLNFAKADGSLVLMVVFGPGHLFQEWKAQGGFFNSAVSGIGDEAFNGPKGMAPYVLFIRKGDHSVSLSSFLDVDTTKPLLSQDQLRSLAKTILSRW